MSSAISAPTIGHEVEAPLPEAGPSRFVYRIYMSRTAEIGYRDVMIIIGDNGDFSVTGYQIGLAQDYSSAKASESWAMVRAEDVERLSYALASAAGGPGREAACCFVRRPSITDLERECVERAIRITAHEGCIDSFTRVLSHHGVPFEGWNRPA